MFPEIMVLVLNSASPNLGKIVHVKFSGLSDNNV